MPVITCLQNLSFERPPSDTLTCKWPNESWGVKQHDLNKGIYYCARTSEKPFSPGQLGNRDSQGRLAKVCFLPLEKHEYQVGGSKYLNKALNIQLLQQTMYNCLGGKNDHKNINKISSSTR